MHLLKYPSKYNINPRLTLKKNRRPSLKCSLWNIWEKHNFILPCVLKEQYYDGLYLSFTSHSPSLNTYRAVNDAGRKIEPFKSVTVHAFWQKNSSLVHFRFYAVLFPSPDRSLYFLLFLAFLLQAFFFRRAFLLMVRWVLSLLSHYSTYLTEMASLGIFVCLFLGLCRGVTWSTSILCTVQTLEVYFSSSKGTRILKLKESLPCFHVQHY